MEGGRTTLFYCVNVMEIIRIINNKKFTYKIIIGNKVIKIPNQSNFKNSYIKNHGCSLVAFYMAQKFIGKNKTVRNCLNYLEKHRNLREYSKYSLFDIYDSLNELKEGCAKYSSDYDNLKIKSFLKSGGMILFEENDPIHTSVLLQKGNKILRISNGYYKVVNIGKLNKCKNKHYKGVVYVKNV